MLPGFSLASTHSCLSSKCRALSAPTDRFFPFSLSLSCRVSGQWALPCLLFTLQSLFLLTPRSDNVPSAVSSFLICGFLLVKFAFKFPGELFISGTVHYRCRTFLLFLFHFSQTSSCSSLSLSVTECHWDTLIVCFWDLLSKSYIFPSFNFYQTFCYSLLSHWSF